MFLELRYCHTGFVCLVKTFQKKGRSEFLLIKRKLNANVSKELLFLFVIIRPSTKECFPSQYLNSKDMILSALFEWKLKNIS